MFKSNKWVTKNGCTIYQILSGRCNCYLVTNGHKAFLVDTGVRGEWKKLYSRMMQLCSQDITIEAVILTHTHFDHAANAAQVKESFQARVLVHKDEAEFLERGSSPIPRGTILLTKTLVLLAKDRDMSFTRFTATTGDIIFDDIYDLSEFGFNAYIIHTPGHSVGSASIIVDDEIALVGDCMVGIIRGIIFPPFADQPELIVSSWEKLLGTGCSLFLPAHGSGNNRESVEKHYQIYKKRLEKEKENQSVDISES